MRYLISESFAATVPARQKYIWDSMNLWTKQNPMENGFITLESIPACSLDVLFIIGHNFQIEHYLDNCLSEIYENNVVVITCNSGIQLSRLCQLCKNIYLTHQGQERIANLLNGTKYGFTFDLTESELIFYSNRHLTDITTRINNAFTRVK